MLPKIAFVQAHEIAPDWTVAVFRHVFFWLLLERCPVFVVTQYVILHLIDPTQVSIANFALSTLTRKHIAPITVLSFFS